MDGNRLQLCDIEISGGNNPWGDLFNDTDEYLNDKYGDEHPVWNISVLATVRIEIKQEDLLYLLLPANLYNESYVSANVHFDNGNVRESFNNVGFRVKGQASRLDQKKGWYVKFNEFVCGQDLKGVKKLGFKGAGYNDDSSIKTRLISDFYRAVGRSARAAVWVRAAVY